MCDKKCQTTGFGSSLQASGHGGTARSEYPRDRLQQLEKDVLHWETECRAAIAQRDEARKAVTEIVRVFPPEFTLNDKQVAPDNVIDAVRYAFGKRTRYWAVSKEAHDARESNRVLSQECESLHNAHKNICQLAGEQDELIKEQQRRLAELECFAHAVKAHIGYDTGHDVPLSVLAESVDSVVQANRSMLGNNNAEPKSLQETAADAINHMITSGEWQEYPETRQHVCNLSHDYASFNRKS